MLCMDQVRLIIIYMLTMGLMLALYLGVLATFPT